MKTQALVPLTLLKHVKRHGNEALSSVWGTLRRSPWGRMAVGRPDVGSHVFPMRLPIRLLRRHMRRHMGRSSRSVADWARFAARWARNPLSVGAMTPSSRHLAAAMARQVVPDFGMSAGTGAGTGAEMGWVVELGPGTGAITRGLLAHRVAPQRLVLVERDPAFAAMVRQRFPNLRVLCGDAAQAEALMRSVTLAETDAAAMEGMEGMEGAVGVKGSLKATQPIAAIISSLPFLSMPREQARAILAAWVPLMVPNSGNAPQSLWVQYTYGPAPPLPEGLARELGLVGHRVERVLRNLPPATVWCYHRST